MVPRNNADSQCLLYLLVPGECLTHFPIPVFTQTALDHRRNIAQVSSWTNSPTNEQFLEDKQQEQRRASIWEISKSLQPSGAMGSCLSLHPGMWISWTCFSTSMSWSINSMTQWFKILVYILAFRAVGFLFVCLFLRLIDLLLTWKRSKRREKQRNIFHPTVHTPHGHIR